ADIGGVVADCQRRLAGDPLVVDVAGRGSDLAGEDVQTGLHKCFAADAGFRVVGQDGVEDRVRAQTGHLVRVAFGYRLRGKQVIVHLAFSPAGTSALARAVRVEDASGSRGSAVEPRIVDAGRCFFDHFVTTRSPCRGRESRGKFAA